MRYKNNLSDEEKKLIEDGKILDIIEGQFLPLNGTYYNGNYFPPEIYENIIDELKEKIDNRILFGTLGHENRPIDDHDVMIGNVAIVTTKLNRDNHIETYVLPTQTGLLLHGYIQSGAKLGIGIRATGQIEELEIEDKKVKSIIPDTLKIYGFNITLNHD